MFDEKNKDILNEDISAREENTAGTEPSEKEAAPADTDPANPETESAPETADAAEPVSDSELLKDENDKLKKQINDLSDRYLRALAEYDNYRKRSSKEKDGAYADAYTDVLKQILPVIDNLERAAAFTGNAPEDDNIAKGVAMTLKSFEDALKKLGVEEIEALGQPFDPVFHNAVMHIEDENLGKNVVAEVLLKGYKKGDRVIRYSMVKVAN
ncbi:MAG: nucleotide exchange factor GrpE [Eubacteriales bacterium]|jgi:molecular chaperone GrpE